jgi:hypothetical protein
MEYIFFTKHDKLPHIFKRRSIHSFNILYVMYVLFCIFKVEQISSETEEETVVLSANLSDGSISYHGSELGRLFLDSHDEFKSQYLGFCLKSKYL